MFIAIIQSFLTLVASVFGIIAFIGIFAVFAPKFNLNGRPATDKERGGAFVIFASMIAIYVLILQLIW